MAAVRRKRTARLQYRVRSRAKAGATLRTALALAALSSRTAGKRRRLPRDLSSRDPI